MPSLVLPSLVDHVKVKYPPVEDEEDFGALIYREYQLRKAEAAAAAANLEVVEDAVSLENLEVNVAPAKKRRLYSSSYRDEGTRERVDSKKYEKRHDGGQRSNYAAVKDVQVKFIVEECARSMLQRSSNAAGRDAQTMLKREEYAPDMEHLRSNSLLCMPFLLVTSYYHLVHPVTKFAPRFHFQMSWKHDISLQLQ